MAVPVPSGVKDKLAELDGAFDSPNGSSRSLRSTEFDTMYKAA